MKHPVKQLKPLSFIFSPLVGAFIAGYLLLKLKDIPAKYFALIAIAGLILSVFNGVITVIKISRR